LTIPAAAREKPCLQVRALSFLVCLLAVIGGAGPLQAQQAAGTPGTPQAVIQRIEFVGNRRIQRDTLLARIFSRPGDPYSEEGARRDFQALWNTQFFEDVRLEIEDSPDQPNGKILVFYVQERPIIRRIEYKGNKSVSESDILDRYKDRKVGLSVESQFDPTKIKRAEVVLKELLAEHGRQFATVKPTYERIAATNAVKLVFNIDEGPKVKVGHIIIQGNHAFSSRQLIRAMRHSRPYAIPLGPLGSIAVLSKTFDRRKLDEDLEVGIRGFYQDHGYFKVLVKDPVLKTGDVTKGIVRRKQGKETDITIPIEEGERYRMGKLVIRSADPDVPLFFKQEFLTQAFPLKEGDIFSTDKIRKALDNYRKLYGQFGYIDFTSQPLFEIDDAKKVVGLTMEFDQEKQFRVRRIEFSGNTTTRDKVIRRQLLIDEGQVFNDHYWELSLLRLNQLDYFDTIKPENAELKRNTKEGTVDINLKVHEKGKQSISFTGGVSGLAGSFVGLTYQTNNFLGLGETLTVTANVGDRQRNILFGFTEPYLFDRPISTGFTVFASRFDYNQQRETSLLLGQQVAVDPALAQNYTQDQKGFTLFASYPLRHLNFTRVGLNYGFTTSNITAFSQSSQLLFTALQFQSLAGPSALNGIRSSSLQPTITYNTINNPVNPTGGKSFFFGSKVEGGPLQGNVDTFTSTFSTTYFHSVNKKRDVIGVHFMTSLATGYSGKELPPFDRFFMGGENDVRGFDFYTISPWAFIPTTTGQTIVYLDPTVIGRNGLPTPVAITVPVLQFVATRPGGDYETVGNVEYRIPIAGPVSLSLFTDIGLDGILRTNQLQLSSLGTSKLQQLFPNPDSNIQIKQQLPIVSGTNFHPRMSSGIEIVVRVPIINAPFRFYYAYNVLRLDQLIVQPTGGFSFNRMLGERQHLQDIGVFNSEVVPQLDAIIAAQTLRFPTGLLEPHHAFRFSVNRTF
jgi:outer membrane protein insertion porin family